MRFGTKFLLILIIMAMMLGLPACGYVPVNPTTGQSTEPSAPTQTKPTQKPSDPPTEPTTLPIQPSEPTTPPTEPTEPPTVPTEPPVPPTEPPTEPTEPPTEPTDPAPCQHDYAAEVIAPSCVEQGYTSYTCKLCGDSYVDGYTDPVGHTYGDWVLQQEPTCTKAGKEISSCENCGATQTRSVDAKGHSYGAWNTTVAATCTAQGEKMRTCADCGNAEKKSVAATGHAYDDGTVIKPAASCSDTGIKSFTCKNCGHQYETKVMGDHAVICNTCKYYGQGGGENLHEAGIMLDMEHEVGCQNCDYCYMDKGYYYLCNGTITKDSAMFTDTIRLTIPEYNGVLLTWPERWHEFAKFTQLGIMYGSWSAKDGWEGQDYEMRVKNISSYADAEAVLADYNVFVKEFAKVYHWTPVEVKMEYREQYQYVRLYYTDQDQYNAYRQQKKKITAAQKDALADEIIGYTLQKWGFRDGMVTANVLEYLYYMIWNDVAIYDHSLRFHDAFDGFAAGICVCDGYSEMFLMYAEALGINAVEVTGRLQGTGHAWNKVIFSDGTGWYVDVTNGPILYTSQRLKDAGYTWKEK